MNMATDIQDSRVLIIAQAIIKQELHIKALIQDIQRTADNEQNLEKLHLEVQKAVHKIRANIDELERISKEQEREKDKEEILSDINNHKQQLSSLQSALRRATLSAQVMLEKKSRSALLEDSSGVSTRHRAKRDKEDLTKLSSDVTNNLMSISRALAGQVSLSEDSLQTLVNSSQKVTDTQEELKTMGSIIHQSKKLLSKYNRREVTDKVLIFLALAFFFAVVLYVMKRRIF